MSEPDLDYTIHLARNLAFGVVVAFLVSAAMCFVGSQDLQESLLIAVVPSIFTGPYIGLLLNMALAPEALEAPAAAAPTTGASPLPVTHQHAA